MKKELTKEQWATLFKAFVAGIITILLILILVAA